MAMVRYAARTWAEGFAPCTAIVVSLNQPGNGTERWQIRPVQRAVSGLPGTRVAEERTYLRSADPRRSEE